LKGLELIVLGFLFKTVIANPCAMVADPVFANAAAATPLTIYCASLAFAAQLYMDFLGYTHIARGVSLLFNIELPLNFDHPFHAPNIANHWQRWHITLSRWLHDYVYQPFGGTKKSLLLTIRNVFITFLICGIWHGAGWNYLIFGLYYGLVIGLYHAYRRCRNAVFKTKQRIIIENGIYKAAGHFVTFWLIVVGMVIFRAPNVATIGIFVSGLLNIPLLLQGVVAHVRTNDFVEIATCLLCLAVLVCGPKMVELYQQLFKPMPHWIKVQMASVAIVLCWIFCSSPIKQFIYFQF
jgi:alginate O-acetyltransferase complex protein AlgI